MKRKFLIFLLAALTVLGGCGTDKEAKSEYGKAGNTDAANADITWESVFGSLKIGNMAVSENDILSTGVSGSETIPKENGDGTEKPDGEDSQTDMSGNSQTADGNHTGNGTENVSGDVSENGLSLSELVAYRIEKLKAIYPDGMYFNDGGVTDTPCNHRAAGGSRCNTYESATDAVYADDPDTTPDQCLGFANTLSDYIFGNNAPVATFTDFDELRVGDHIRLNWTHTVVTSVSGGDDIVNVYHNAHSMIVIEKGEDYVRVAECNADFVTCKIEWGRQYTREYLEERNAVYITRYEDVPEDAVSYDITGYIHQEESISSDAAAGVSY